MAMPDFNDAVREFVEEAVELKELQKALRERAEGITAAERRKKMAEKSG